MPSPEVLDTERDDGMGRNATETDLWASGPDGKAGWWKKWVVARVSGVAPSPSRSLGRWAIAEWCERDAALLSLRKIARALRTTPAALLAEPDATGD